MANDLNPIVVIRKYQREESRKEFTEALGVSEALIMSIEDGELPVLLPARCGTWNGDGARCMRTDLLSAGCLDIMRV